MRVLTPGDSHIPPPGPFLLTAPTASLLRLLQFAPQPAGGGRHHQRIELVALRAAQLRSFAVVRRGVHHQRTAALAPGGG
jgi:hypothetical protein